MCSDNWLIAVFLAFLLLLVCVAAFTSIWQDRQEHQQDDDDRQK